MAPPTPPLLQVICFSMDRVFQLSEYLRTLQRYVRFRGSAWGSGCFARVAVICRCSSPAIRTHYEALERRHAPHGVRFVYESDARSFADCLLLSLATGGAAEELGEAEAEENGAVRPRYVLFNVDDAFYFDDVELADAFAFLEGDTGASSPAPTPFAFHVKLAPSIWRSHLTSSPMLPLPAMYTVVRRHARAATSPSAAPEPLEPAFHVFEPARGTLDWNYPWELSGSVYLRSTVEQVVAAIRAKFGNEGLNHPNHLELRGHQVLPHWMAARAVKRLQCACSLSPKMHVFAVNQVQDVFQNRLYEHDVGEDGGAHAGDITNLLRLYEAGETLDEAFYRRNRLSSVHIGTLVLKARDAGRAVAPALDAPARAGRNGKPLVSVVIPVFNVAAYVEQAVASIMRQTYQHLEILVVDDASTDATPDIVARLQAQDARVRLVRNAANLGVAASLNKGFAAATGELVARMDGDDVSFPSRIERQVDYLLENPHVGIVGASVLVLRDSAEPASRVHPEFALYETAVYPTSPLVTKWRMLFGCFIAHPTVMMRRTVLATLAGTEPREYYSTAQSSSEDYELWLRCLYAHNLTVQSMGDVLVVHRKHGSNVSKVRRERQVAETQAIATKYILSVAAGSGGGGDDGGVDISRIRVRLLFDVNLSDSVDDLKGATELLHKLQAAICERPTSSSRAAQDEHACEQLYILQDVASREGELALQAMTLDSIAGSQMWSSFASRHPEVSRSAFEKLFKKINRLNRFESEAPVYFPSIVTGSSTQERKFTPIPPQRGRPHPKKHQHGNDSRIQLEPLRPSSSSSGSSAGGNAGTTPSITIARGARVSISLSAEHVGLDAKILGGSSTTEENIRRFHAMESKIAFYRQLASLKLREVVATEQSVLKTIDSVLQACTTALDADCVVLYSMNEAAQTVHVTACSRAEAVGFQAPLAKFAMETLIQHAYQEHADGETHSYASEPVYFANLQASPGYDPAFDIDSMTGIATSSILAGVIGDENGKPIFIVEARCARETLFSDSVFRAGMATLENIVYQFDLTQVLARTMDMYASLDEILQATITRPSDPNAEQDDTDSSSAIPVKLTKNLNNEADPELEELLLKPPLTSLDKLARIVLRRSCSDGVCLLKVNPSRQTCEVVASASAATSGQLVDASKLESLFSAAKSLDVGAEASNADPTLPLLLRLVKSFERGKVIELSDDTDFQAALLSGDFKTILFVPIPTSSACSLTGVLFMSTAEHHGYDLRAIRPLTCALALALAVQKRDADMHVSTVQKLKLIHLYSSHFEIDTINDPSTLVNMICEIGCETFNTARVTLYVADPIKSELWSLSTLGSVNGLRIPYGTGIAGIAASTKKKLVVLNAYDDPRFDRSFDIKFGFKTESLITFPVLDKNGETLGVIQAVNTQHFMDPDAHPLTAKFDERVLDVFNHMVSHALRVNSSLIMFAKVQSDYWLNRAVMDVKGADDGSLKSDDLASVHYLLDTSGFDEAKRVPRNKWSTFAYACWALGKFLLARYQMRREKRGAADELSKWAVDETNLRTGSKVGANRCSISGRSESIIRAGRTNSLVNRWRRLALSPAVDEDELLSDNFNPLTKTLAELKQHSFKLFEGLMLISTFRIDESVLRCFIDTLAGRYRPVAYHSFYHGFDVALNSYCLIRKTAVITMIKEFEALSLMVAALGHDADHPGNDNQFEVDTNSPLALCYNDISVLENHHASTTFSVLRLDSCNILKGLSASAKVSVRTAIVRCILATGDRGEAADGQHDYPRRGLEQRSAAAPDYAAMGRPGVSGVRGPGAQVRGTRRVRATAHREPRGRSRAVPVADQLYRLPRRAALELDRHDPAGSQVVIRRESAREPRLLFRARRADIGAACGLRDGDFNMTLNEVDSSTYSMLEQASSSTEISADHTQAIAGLYKRTKVPIETFVDFDGALRGVGHG
ncbi:hypothetical protein PybrP1_000555 [[Pythium] brassicae (nom. inval.)]|nr:hypothetical protein PybrP1_000555 [[Pythium] brassicae (nom. inval.)]